MKEFQKPGLLVMLFDFSVGARLNIGMSKGKRGRFGTRMVRGSMGAGNAFKAYRHGVRAHLELH